MKFTRTSLVICALILSSGLVQSAERSDPVAQILKDGPKTPFAYQWLSTLCDEVGPRLAGSPAYDRAAAWAVESLRSTGVFDRVWTEPAKVPSWTRGLERAEITAPFQSPLPVMTLGQSVGTAPGGLEAEVLVVSSFDELEERAAEAQGKIVLFDQPWAGYGASVQYRTRGASAAARHGAVAVLVRSVTNLSLATLHTGMMRYDEAVPKIPAACITVEDAGRLHRLFDAGKKVKIHLELGAENHDPIEQSNILAEIKGRELPDEIVLISGHLDSWDTGTGAQDDGAGCAIAVGAAHLIKSLGLRPRRTIRVVLFASEEFGGYGGQAYLETHRQELDRHVAAMEADSGCFPPNGFSVKADDPIIQRITAMTEPLGELLGDGVRPGWAGVDVGPIVREGVPGIGIQTKSDNYFHYHHSPADTLDKVRPEDLAANVTASATLLWSIAEDQLSLRSPQNATEGATD